MTVIVEMMEIRHFESDRSEKTFSQINALGDSVIDVNMNSFLSNPLQLISLQYITYLSDHSPNGLVFLSPERRMIE